MHATLYSSGDAFSWETGVRRLPAVDKHTESHFRKVANNMAPAIVYFGDNVKQERIDIIVQSSGTPPRVLVDQGLTRQRSDPLMIQEQLRKQAQVLAVDFVLLAIHFEDRNRRVTVDLVAGWVAQVTLDLLSTSTMSMRMTAQDRGRPCLPCGAATFSPSSCT